MEPLKNYNRVTDGELEAIEQALTYYRVLSRGGEGAAFYCHKGEERVSESGKAYSPMLQYCTRDEESFKQQYLRSWKSDSYITVNQFTGEYRYDEGAHKRGWFRKEKDCCGINGIFIDFDIMKGKEVRENYTVEEGDRIIREVLFKINRLVEEGAMVKPTLVTLSGRGIQMLFLYGESISTEDTEAMYEHKRLYSHIVGFLQGYFDKDYVEVDTSVRDYSRICRLPGTMHTKNGRMATLQEVNACLYDVDGLCEFFGVNLAPEEKKKPGRKAKKVASISKQAPRRRSYEPVLDKNKSVIKGYNVINFEEKLAKRRNVQGKIAALEKLASNRGMYDGDKREITLHIYYSLQRQVNKAEEAAEHTRSFNSSFAEPLPECVVRSLIKNADTHRGALVDCVREAEGSLVSTPHQYPSGYYEASREGIIKMLGMTEEEVVYTGITKRQKEKERALLNNEIEARVKARLIEMLGSGASKPEMVKYIKQESGKSRATAYRWITDCETEIAKRKMEENAERETEVESFLSHFGVNVKEEINIEEAKGGSERRLVLLTDNSDPSKNKVWIQKIEEDEKYNYIYNKIEYPTPKGMHCQESYEIRLRSDELSRYYLRKSTKIMYSPSGEILSKKETDWEIRGPGMFRKAV